MNSRKTLVIAGMLAALGGVPLLMAAEHVDGAGVRAEPALDITDLYAWVTPQDDRLNLVMNVHPGATTASAFSSTAQYAFHTTSGMGLPSSTDPGADIICTFDAAQVASCWGGGSYVTGDASNPAGITSADGKLRVFAGLRDDPAFFNVDGLVDATGTLAAVGQSLTYDSNGCPSLDAATSNLVVSMLGATGNGSGPPMDFFAAQNVLSVVVSIDKALVTTGGPIVSVSASTRK